MGGQNTFCFFFPRVASLNANSHFTTVFYWHSEKYCFAFVQICNGNPANVPSRHTGNLYCSETIVSGNRCGLLHSSALKSSETLPVAHLGKNKKIPPGSSLISTSCEHKAWFFFPPCFCPFPNLYHVTSAADCRVNRRAAVPLFPLCRINVWQDGLIKESDVTSHFSDFPQLHCLSLAL